MARFDNKVVLVSGGARGQGAAEARLLVAQGAKVVIGDVLDNQGQALAAELGPAERKQRCRCGRPRSMRPGRQSEESPIFGRRQAGAWWSAAMTTRRSHQPTRR
jgi:NAD(P)-dependent dehydrogenase (short-subunit alcohol dehydrogenase family)